MPNTITGMGGIAGTLGNTLLKSLPSLAEVFFLSDPCHPASLQQPCKCRYLPHMKIYGEIAFPWSKRTRSWLFLCWGGREGLSFSVFWSKAHSCYMRTPWKCNLSSPRHRLGLTICLRPQSEDYLWLNIPCMGQILKQASARENNKVRKKCTWNKG